MRRRWRNGAPCALQVDARHEAAELLEQLHVVELRRAAAVAGVDGEAEVAVDVQRLAVVRRAAARPGIFLGRELVGEVVLLVDRLVRPAAGPVELGDHRRGILEPDAVDAVLVAVQRQQPAVAARPTLSTDAMMSSGVRSW